MDFSFIYFSTKIYENSFHKWGLPYGYIKLYTRSKKEKQDLSRKCSAWKVYRLRFLSHPSLRHMVKYGGWYRERGVEVWGGEFISLKEAYIPNLSLSQSLEAFEK